MDDTPLFSMPDMETKAKLDKAAEIMTGHMDLALQDCIAAGLDREFFNAAVVATLMQTMETSLGGSAQVAGALQEMAHMAAASAEREAMRKSD